MPISSTPSSPSRREALRLLGAAATSVLAGCTPIRFMLNDAPAPFRRDQDVTEPILRAFVAAVVPGVSVERPGAARVFFDPFYPLTRHRAWLAADLDARAQRRHRLPFDGLSLPQRAQVIRDGLAGGGVVPRIYAGAVFLAQVAVFGGLTDPQGGCDLIGFPEPGDLLPLERQTYPDPGRFLGSAFTADGNPT